MDDEYIEKLESYTKSVIEWLRNELKPIRTNRPSVHILEDINVSYYDQSLPLKQLASIMVKPPRDIEINVWDKSAAPAVYKAIEESNAGLLLKKEGETIIASIPQLTEERRTEFARLAKKISEEAKIRVRSKRDEIIKEIKHAKEDGELTEDAMFKLKDKVQDLIDKVNSEIERVLDGKLEELRE